MKYELKIKVQHSKKCKDGRRRNYYLYFLNDVLILKQKAPFDEKWDHGWQYQTSLSNTYLLNGRIHQTREVKNPSAWWRGPANQREGTKVREVKFPVSKKVLEQFNIPTDLKIAYN